MRAESAKTAWHARPRCRTLIGVAALAFGLSASLTGATAAAAAPSLDLRNAPVPAGLCGHPSGHLVNGKRHLGTSGDDYLQRSYSGTIRGGATAIAVLGCNAGGVSWPQTLVFYRQLPDGSPAIVASYYLAKIRHSEHVDVHSAQIRDGRFTAVLDSYEGAGCKVHKIFASFHLKSGAVVVSNPLKGPVVDHCQS